MLLSPRLHEREAVIRPALPLVGIILRSVRGNFVLPSVFFTPGHRRNQIAAQNPGIEDGGKDAAVKIARVVEFSRNYRVPIVKLRIELKKRVNVRCMNGVSENNRLCSPLKCARE